MSLIQVANALGIGPVTLKRWYKTHSPNDEKSSMSLVRVLTGSQRETSVRVQTASGFFADFGSVESAAKFFRMLH